MKRDIYSKLLEWKESNDRKPLMLYGARQVGKTYILKELGRNEFDNMVCINCYKNPIVEKIFSQDVDITRILRELSAYSGENIQPSSTFLFFDEVQEIPEVVASLKYFYEERPELHVAVAGSLLGVMEMKGISFPVGKVDIMHLYPMVFTEFLEAVGETGKLDLLRDAAMRTSVNSLLPSFVELLRQYYYVGGMPEAVKKYIETGDQEKVRKIQLDIIEEYEADIAKHAGRDALKARKVMQSIPGQLAKENKKYIFGALKKGARASEYENAIQWLIDAGIIYKVCRTAKAELPLKFYLEDDTFKLFLLDVGLLGAISNVSAPMILLGNNIFSEYKGAFTENYVLTQLITCNPIEISYFTKDNSTVEIDFLIQFAGKLIPIEVKAEENVKSKSFRQFITIDHSEKNLRGIRMSMKGYADQGWMENIPLFAIIPYLNDILPLSHG
ncbi:MAG: ATP-binding protein [Muribaculaceae bacterium]|nr:ATP-binding protein [Muribaculaceae bacterium]